MQIKRLHILLGGIGVACLAVGGYNSWNGRREAESRMALEHARKSQENQTQRLKSADQQADQAMDRLRQTTRESIATIGEAYRPLNKHFGDIPPISNPLRAAKKYQMEGHTELAMRSARESWLALKAFRRKSGPLSQTYQVVRGDTLWRIAMSHSPARAGEGWVTIWKANKELVRDFNRLEIGWTLKIPPQSSQYVMPFWKPPALH